MNHLVEQALSHAIERSLVRLPQTGERWAFLNALPIPGLPATIRELLGAEQGFRPVYLQLQRQGFAVEPVLLPRETAFDGSLVIAGRSRRFNERNLLRAWNRTRAGGTLVVAGAKTDGIASLQKWARELAMPTGQIAKHHCLIFTMERSGPPREEPSEPPGSDGFRHGAGMFSEQSADTGSRLLAGTFSNRIGGRVADLGAGWGYLSVELLRRSQAVTSIDLHEAEWLSLEAARLNLADAAIPVEFHWIDVTSELRKRPFDWVIMNPPFHRGRTGDPELGKSFIGAAASTLVPGGRLLMVANRHLPYEAVLKANFRRITSIAEDSGYKVIEAQR